MYHELKLKCIQFDNNVTPYQNTLIFGSVKFTGLTEQQK